MDYKGQTAVLFAFFLVGMIFLVPVITEKALAGVDATATGTCGPEGQTHPCKFTLDTYDLSSGSWVTKPTSGTVVKWSTTGHVGDEKGIVVYYVDNMHRKERANLEFDNPLIGSNSCKVGGPWITEAGNKGDCNAGKGQNAEFTYKLTQLNPYYGTPRPSETTPEKQTPEENHTASTPEKQTPEENHTAS